ncbi:MAG: rhodanese-like domain-containing protein [Gaiellaceae bacterium]
MLIVARPTPGHRPEHTAYVIEDRSRGETPWLLLTGDSLFVGDIARPDLAVEPEEGARDLFRSLRSLDRLDDYVEVWPGHIGGSLCGGAGMSETPGSTLGFERRFNRFLKIDEEQEFVRELTHDLAPQPPNFQRIVELNRGPLLTEAAPLDPIVPARLQELLTNGATLIDGREPREFDAAHISGSLNVTMVRAAVGTRAALVVDPNTQVVVTAAGDADAKRMALMLEAVGFRQLRGYLAGGLPAWQAADLPTSATEAIDVATLAERLKAKEVVLLDVREQDEWQDGHVEGSLHLPFHELRDGIPSELRQTAAQKPLAVACSAGNRSSLAVSLLRRHGVHEVQHVAGGGVDDLTEYGVELTEEETR